MTPPEGLNLAPSHTGVQGEGDNREQSATRLEPAAKDGILKWLESATKEKPEAAVEEVELWRVTKDMRELRCVVRYLPHGLDLRLMQGDEFRRTELLKDAAATETRAAEWRTSTSRARLAERLGYPAHFPVGTPIGGYLP